MTPTPSTRASGKAPLKIGILISGRGSNMEALITACADPAFPAEIALVISNRPNAAGLNKAHKAGIATAVIDHKVFADRNGFETTVHAKLVAAGCELICLAGFMRLLTDGFVEHWHNRLINIHPSLLPSFKGLDTHKRAIEAGVRFHGATVHYVRPAMDEGPILVQACVPILNADTPDSLGARVLEQEHRIYPLALRLIAEDQVELRGERVIVHGGSGRATAEALPPMINPPPEPLY